MRYISIYAILYFISSYDVSLSTRNAACHLLNQSIINQDPGHTTPKNPYRVKKATSEIAIIVNGEKAQDYSIPNNTICFSKLFHDLTQVAKPEIIFGATGIYSQRLEAFLKNNNFVYRLNPLEAKKNWIA